MSSEIDIEAFSKIDLRVGLVESAERVEGTKLIRLTVYLGEELGRRQVVAGIGEYYSPEQLVGRKVIVVANLRPKKIRGLVSQGMILAAGCGQGERPVVLVPENEAAARPGSKVC
ncbi:MAG: methionine--tRNA ligase subunit beta [Fervidicoccaceae archaeon]